MSDLQCPATLLVLPSGDAELPVVLLRQSRLAAVYAEPADRASADRFAGVVGVAVRTLAREGAPYVERLGDLADLHRGETILVLLPAGDVATLAAQKRVPDEARTGLEVTIDSDGWVFRVWPDQHQRTRNAERLG